MGRRLFRRVPRTEEQGLSAESFISPGLDALRSGWVQSSLPVPVQDRFDAVMEGMSYDEVRERFDRYGLLDDQVQFLRGWFRDTLPSAPIERLALLRLKEIFTTRPTMRWTRYTHGYRPADTQSLTTTTPTKNADARFTTTSVGQVPVRISNLSTTRPYFGKNAIEPTR
jgi:hypothetical protein